LTLALESGREKQVDAGLWDTLFMEMNTDVGLNFELCSRRLPPSTKMSGLASAELEADGGRAQIAFAFAIKWD